MSKSGKVAVQATKREYYGLQHVCGDVLDEHGRGEWPRDSFTFRLRDEKAIRLIEDEAEVTVPAAEKKPAAKKARAKAEPTPSTTDAAPATGDEPQAMPAPTDASTAFKE